MTPLSLPAELALVPPPPGETRSDTPRCDIIRGLAAGVCRPDPLTGGLETVRVLHKAGSLLSEGRSPLERQDRRGEPWVHQAPLCPTTPWSPRSHLSLQRGRVVGNFLNRAHLRAFALALPFLESSSSRPHRVQVSTQVVPPLRGLPSLCYSPSRFPVLFPRCSPLPGILLCFPSENVSSGLLSTGRTTPARILGCSPGPSPPLTLSGSPHWRPQFPHLHSEGSGKYSPSGALRGSLGQARGTDSLVSSMFIKCPRLIRGSGELQTAWGPGSGRRNVTATVPTTLAPQAGGCARAGGSPSLPP